MINGIGQSTLYNVYQNPNSTSNQTEEVGNNVKNTDDSSTVEDKSQSLDVEKEEQTSDNDPEVQRQIQQLVTAENKVIAHEQAHMSAGGQFTGGASYSYTVGPDGRRYISGGEVSISIPSSDDPEEKLRLLERVRQAALAPANPSPQDVSVASNASSQMGKVNSEISLKRAEEAYGKESDPTQNKVDTEDESPQADEITENDYKPFDLTI